MIYLRQPKCPLAQRLCVRTLCSPNPLKLLVALIARLSLSEPFTLIPTVCAHAHMYAATSMLPIYNAPSPHCAQTHKPCMINNRRCAASLKARTATRTFIKMEIHFISSARGVQTSSQF